MTTEPQLATSQSEIQETFINELTVENFRLKEALNASELEVTRLNQVAHKIDLEAQINEAQCEKARSAQADRIDVLEMSNEIAHKSLTRAIELLEQLQRAGYTTIFLRGALDLIAGLLRYDLHQIVSAVDPDVSDIPF